VTRRVAEVARPAADPRASIKSWPSVAEGIKKSSARWCLGGRSPRALILNSGETESAESDREPISGSESAKRPQHQKSHHLTPTRRRIH
jgi:hypothetical protein